MQKILSTLALLAMAGLVQAESAALLVYQVWERDSAPYFTRILVTDGHVRLDEGREGGDYTLYDRLSETAYSVSVEDRSVLVIAPRPGSVPETNALILDEQQSVDERAPMVAGKRPVSVTFLANGESCGSVVAVSGLMEHALQGLRELRRVLARVHAATLAAQPGQFQAACDLASDVHAPTRMLDHGLPLEERSGGSTQLLIDFREHFDAQPGLFVVPEDFGRLGMPSLPAA